MTTNLRIFNSKIQGNKKVIYSLSLILMLAMTLMMAFAQLGLAQVGISQPVKTAGYISVSPLLVGVGQEATVNLWVSPIPHNYAYQALYEGYNGITVTFTKPDGSKDSFAPVDGTGQYVAGQTEAIGAIFFFYASDMAGNWSVSFTMPEQNITDNTGTVIYSACTSNTAYFTVQEDPVNAGLLNGYPWAQLPNENTYWSYPINSNNREWSEISGDWLQCTIQRFSVISGVGTNLWQPYGSAPNTAHVVWSQPLQAGGIIGGDFGSTSYTSAYSADFYRGVVVMDGKVFANIPNTNTFECIDLTTGEIMYTASGSIDGGIHLPGNAYAQSSLDSSVVLNSSFGAGITPYLFESTGTTWNFYDTFTGTLMRSISNVSASGYCCRLVDGTPFAYGTSGFNLFGWNMSKVVNNDWSTGITWTKPLMPRLYTDLGISSDQSTIVLGSFGGNNKYFAFSTEDGASLWNLTLPYTPSADFSLYGVDDFITFDPVDATFHCYSMLTGAELWTSDSFADSPWATQFTVYNAETNDDNTLYLMFPDGVIRALSLKTGDLVWESTATVSTEYTNNVVPYYIGIVMAGGNIYAYAGYSVDYQINPIPRQAMLVCVNATTGNITWTLNGGVRPLAAANGYIIGLSAYDGNLYCLGKGKTSTSITIQKNVIPQGGTIHIQGNVLDQSPAQSGTPAVSDDSTSEYMDYLHMQNSTLLNSPPTPTGVQVTLTAVDPNDNTIVIGTTTTDASGNFYYSYAPPLTGIYKITATFAGSNSYWSSSSETGVTVTEAVTPTPQPTQPASLADLYFVPGIISAISAIIVVGAVIVLMLRKR
jgi:hypothetical protein